jgi:hypothetical protein
MTGDKKGKWGVQGNTGLLLHVLSLGGLLPHPCTLTGWSTHIYICNGQQAWRYFATSALLPSKSIFQETGSEISLHCDLEKKEVIFKPH